MPANCRKSGNPLGTATKTQILSASELSEKRKSRGDNSENVNFECQRNVGKAEPPWGPQWKHKFRVPAKRRKSGPPFVTTVKTLLLKASEASEKRKSLGDHRENANLESQRNVGTNGNPLGDRSENVNFECQRIVRKTEIFRGPQ